MRLHIFPNPRPGSRILEPVDHLLVPTIMGPGWNKRREVVEPCRISIDVGGDVDAGVSGLLDVGDYFRHPAPVGFACRLQVPDLDGDAGFAANANRLVQRRDDRITLITNVGSVDAAEPS